MKTAMVTDMIGCHDPQRLVGMTVNIYKNSEKRSGFEGAAEVKKLISTSPLLYSADYNVEFSEDGTKAVRTIYLRKNYASSEKEQTTTSSEDY